MALEQARTSVGQRQWFTSQAAQVLAETQGLQLRTCQDANAHGDAQRHAAGAPGAGSAPRGAGLAELKAGPAARAGAGGHPARARREDAGGRDGRAARAPGRPRLPHVQARPLQNPLQRLGAKSSTGAHLDGHAFLTYRRALCKPSAKAGRQIKHRRSPRPLAQHGNYIACRAPSRLCDDDSDSRGPHSWPMKAGWRAPYTEAGRRPSRLLQKSSGP